jgi:hypothetical protein
MEMVKSGRETVGKSGREETSERTTGSEKIILVLAIVGCLILFFLLRIFLEGMLEEASTRAFRSMPDIFFFVLFVITFLIILLRIGVFRKRVASLKRSIRALGENEQETEVFVENICPKCNTDLGPTKPRYCPQCAYDLRSPDDPAGRSGFE